MSKPFFRYEDVPLLLASEGQQPSFVFATQASLSVSQPIDAKKFADDHHISFALQTGDVYFNEAHSSGFLMGPPNGPGVKLSDSIEVIKSGSKISYPGGQSLIVDADVNPGDYYIKVRSTGETTLSYEDDIEQGEIEVLRSYAAAGPTKGSLAITYYMNTGNIQSFFDVTGLMDSTVYPQANEGKVTGCLGDYFFDNAYIRDITFSAKPFEVIQTTANLDIYGNLRYVEGNSESITSNYGCFMPNQKTVPHAINTKINGSDDAGINYPLDFSYSISASRSPCFELPISGNQDPNGEIPTRVTKEAINITAKIRGERLDPYLKITGKRASLNIQLKDLGFETGFTDNNLGTLKEFSLYGVIDSNDLSVSEGGYLAGGASIKQSYR
jgi:hypothetical protein